jgi:hypothetical protein
MSLWGVTALLLHLSASHPHTPLKDVNVIFLAVETCGNVVPASLFQGMRTTCWPPKSYLVWMSLLGVTATHSSTHQPLQGPLWPGALESMPATVSPRYACRILSAALACKACSHVTTPRCMLDFTLPPSLRHAWKLSLGLGPV